MSGRRLSTEEKDKIVDAYVSGAKKKDIIVDYGIDGSTLYDLLKRYGISTKLSRRITEEEMLPEFEALEKYEDLHLLESKWGMTFAQVLYYYRKLTPDKYKAKQGRDYPANDELFQNLDNEFDAWMLGWVWSDGCVYKNRNCFDITYHTNDQELNEKFLESGGKVDK